MNPSPLAVLASSAVLSFLLAAPHEQEMVLTSLEGALRGKTGDFIPEALGIILSIQERVEQARALIETGELPKVAAARVEVWAEGEPAF